MNTLSIAGTTVQYSTSGSGPGLVLVHGTTVDGKANFGHVIERFTDRRRVICPDYAGCGNSTIPDGELRLDLLVEQIAATIRHASPDPVDLLGDSLGSVVAAATAARHPTIVRRLVLIAGWADSSDSRHQLVFGTWATLQKLDSELANRFAFSLAVNPTFFTKLGWDTVQSLLREPARPHAIRRIELGLQLDIRKDLREIVSPTLIIRGAYDYLVPEYQSRVVHESIRGSEYVSVDAGHAVLTEKPDEVVELIRKFLFT